MGLIHFYKKDNAIQWLKIGVETLQKPCWELMRHKKLNKFIKMSEKQKDLHYVYKIRNGSTKFVCVYMYIYIYE